MGANGSGRFVYTKPWRRKPALAVHSPAAAGQTMRYVTGACDWTFWPFPARTEATPT